MKKFWLLAILWLATIALTGCNCDCKNTTNLDDALNNAIAYCNENGWTHSMIHSPTAAYGECTFPSGVICEDTILWTDECNFEPNLENIDTEEKRLAGCIENVEWWMTDYVEGAENVDIQWGEESEGGASFVRNGVVTYTKDWIDSTINVECVADFVDGSISVTYEDEINETIDEMADEIVDEMTDEIVDEEVVELEETGE